MTARSRCEPTFASRSRPRLSDRKLALQLEGAEVAPRFGASSFRALNPRIASNMSFAQLLRLFGRTLQSRQVNGLTCGTETGSHPHQVGKGICPHFSHDLPSVRFYRDFADAQFCADLLV